MDTMRIISPNGHLGFAPLKPESFHLGVAAGPHCIGADSGSDDVGPGPLGSDKSTSPLAWQTHDLEEMLLASRKIGVPMIIGSAGDTGANSRVDLYCKVIRELAAKHKLKKFKLGWYYSELDKEMLRAGMRRGEEIAGLDGRPPLTEAELDATDHIVAMAGVHPYIELLHRGADVIIGGRSATAPCSQPPRFTRGFPKISPVIWERCWNARRSAPSHTAQRKRCWASSAATMSASPPCIPASAAPSPRSPRTPCTSGRILSTSTSAAASST